MAERRRSGRSGGSNKKDDGPPKTRSCGTMEVHERLLRMDPSYLAARNDSENRAFLFAGAAAHAGRTGVTVIPVVVHVVWHTARAEHLRRAGPEPDRRPQPRLPQDECGHRVVAGGLPAAGRRRADRVRARDDRPVGEPDQRHHAHVDDVDRLHRRQQGQARLERRRGRVAARQLPEPLGVPAQRRPAGLCAVPGWPRRRPTAW